MLWSVILIACYILYLDMTIKLQSVGDCIPICRLRANLATSSSRFAFLLVDREFIIEYVGTVLNCSS